MSERGSLFVVVNNAAARARAAWPGVREALVRAGVAFEAHESVRPGETEARTRAALAGGFETVAAVGGDGTLSAAAAGYFEPCEGLDGDASPRAVNPAAALAVLPAGTGDDFARGLSGGRREGIEVWAARLVEHCRTQGAGVAATSPGARATTRAVDAVSGSADGGARRFVCLNASTVGIGAEVAGLVATQGRRVRRLPGEVRFAWAAARSLTAWRGRRARVLVDGGVWVECELNLVAVANGVSAGGGMKFSPGADPSDGLLDVVTVCGISRAGLVRELARVRFGGHLANPKVKLTRGSRVRVETVGGADPLSVEADGDVRGLTPAEFRVMPSALRVVV